MPFLKITIDQILFELVLSAGELVIGLWLINDLSEKVVNFRLLK